MLEKGKISNSQFFYLIVMFIIGASTLIAPPIIAEDALQDSWISCVIGIVYGLVLVKLYGILAKRYPTLTVIEFSEKILGKWIGKTVSSLFLIYFLFLCAGLLRIIGDFLTTHILPETPIQAIEIIFLLTVIMGVRLGLEPFARTSEMVFPYVFIFFALLMIFLFPQVELNNLSPLLENGLNPVLLGSFRVLGMPYLDLVIFLMITPYITKPEKAEKTLLIATFIGGLIFTLIILLSTLVLGTELTSRLHYPTFVLAQKIQVGNFIERIEILSGGMIFIALFFKISISFYALVLGVAQTLELQTYKSVTFPLGIIVVVLSLTFFPNIVYFDQFVTVVWTPLLLIFGFFLPVLLLVIDSIKKMFPQQNNESIRK